MDADLMLEQEEVLSKIKGKYAKRDNPNEVAKLNKTLKKLKVENRDIFDSLKEAQSESTQTMTQLTALLPGLYKKLKGFKELGDKRILLKQIIILQDRLQEVSNEVERLKNSSNEETANLNEIVEAKEDSCLLYTSPSPRDKRQSRMPSSA